MAQMVGKYAAKKLLSSQMNKNKDKHNAEPAGSYVRALSLQSSPLPKSH